MLDWHKHSDSHYHKILLKKGGHCSRPLADAKMEIAYKDVL